MAPTGVIDNWIIEAGFSDRKKHEGERVWGSPTLVVGEVSEGKWEKSPAFLFKGKVDEILLSFGRMADGGGGKVEAFLSSWLFLHQTFGSNMLPCFVLGGRKMMKVFWFHIFWMFGNCSLYLPNQLLVEIHMKKTSKFAEVTLVQPTNLLSKSHGTPHHKSYRRQLAVPSVGKLFQ